MRKICFLLTAFLFVFSNTVFAQNTISIDAYSDLREYVGITDDNITPTGILINFDNAAILGNDSTRNLEYDVPFYKCYSKNYNCFG